MEAVRIKDTGAEGVVIAMKDGMKAASYARQLDAAHASNDLLTAENRSLRTELRKQAAQIEKLKKNLRYYKGARNRAVSWTLVEQAAQKNVLLIGAAVAAGAVLMCGVCIAVLCIAGV